MSENQPPENPYGQQPAYSAGGQQQPYYGQQPQDPAAYAYAEQPYGAYAGQDQRPATVTAAGWITIITSGLTALMMLVFVLGTIVAREPMIDMMRTDPNFRDAVASDEQVINSLASGVIAFFVAMAVWALIALVLGVLVLRRSNVARILLVISSGVTALLTLVMAVGAIIPGAWTLAAIAVIVLLFVGGAGDWFARRSPQPGYGAPQGG